MDIKSRGIHRKHVGVERMHFLDEAVDAILKKSVRRSGWRRVDGPPARFRMKEITMRRALICRWVIFSSAVTLSSQQIGAARRPVSTRPRRRHDTWFRRSAGWHIHGRQWSLRRRGSALH